jgi:hypothetical protein
MSFTHQVTEKVLVGGESISNVSTLTSGSKISIDESMPVATDTPLAITLDVSQAKSVYILSDRDITIETNATNAAGGNTLALKANIPYVWYTNKYHALVFTADITVAYITNAAAGAARLQIEILFDPTV